MNTLLNSLVLVFLFSLFANGTSIKKRHEKFVAHEFEDVRASSLDKRSETNGFADYDGRFRVNLKIGSAQEGVPLFLDTGSLYVNVPGANCTCKDGKPCSSDISWNPLRSTTFKNLSIPAETAFGTIMAGSEVADDVYFDGGDKLPQFHFSLLSNLLMYEIGILGLAYSTRKDNTYVAATKAAGLINHAAFSVFKGQGNDGTFLLGGVDKAKYEGDLFIFDSTAAMPVKKLTTNTGKVIPLDYPIIHDSGTPTMFLLDSAVQEIFKDIGADEKGYVPCDHVFGGNKNMTVTIGPVNIPLFYSHFFHRVSGSTCVSSIHSTSIPKHQVLGLPFFRNAYLAQNFDTKKIAIAPIKHTDESDIVDFWF